ncbi:MAG: serine protease [Cyanobacteria bacterium J06626_6]
MFSSALSTLKKVALTTLGSAATLTYLSLPGLAQVDETIKTGAEVNEISQSTTLLILATTGDGQIAGNGSGSLIAKEGNTCVGVTNRHVIDGANEFRYVVRTADREIHPVKEIRAFNQEDLAIVTFECQQNYTPVPLATYQLSPGQEVYLSGWPADSTPDGSYARHFTSGSISTILDSPVAGYQVGYTNVTNSGMSGGQVLDAAGRLVSIHGVGARQDSARLAARLGIEQSVASELADKTGFNYGIPVTTFLARASQAGFNYPFNVVYSAPQAPASGPVSQGSYTYEPDANDQVDLDDTLNNVNSIFNTIDRGANTFCRFLGC